MINITELKEHFEAFKREKTFISGIGVVKFIDYIDQKQKERGRSVITLEQREGARRLKELKERQAQNKPITPEEDYNNI